MKTLPLLSLHLQLFTASSIAWDLGQFKHFVVFGDSYTDQGRLGYFQSHNGSAPGPHDVIPNKAINADGGRTWPQYVGQYEPGLSISNYAVSGASCSNEITPRYEPDIGQNYPSVREYQIPAFFKDVDAGVLNIQGVPTKGQEPHSNDTVYAVFIGTNDLGMRAFIDDEQAKGKNLADYVGCVFEGVQELYKRGARYFVLIGLINLYQTPLYTNFTQHGLASLSPPNTTLASEKMRQYVQASNELYKYRAAYAAFLDKNLTGAHFSIFDTEALFWDIYARPGDFLNGTQKPYDVHDYWMRTKGNSPDSFVWYDPLHPSEQIDRVIARVFLAILRGHSKYGLYYN